MKFPPQRKARIVQYRFGPAATDVEFDPHRKFLKKAGYAGNAVSTHPAYVERGCRANCFWSDDPEEAKGLLDMGMDSILTNDWLRLSNALGLK